MSFHLITLKQDTEHHRCGLPGEPWDILPKFVESGLFVELRRKLKRFVMINKKHPLTRAYASSLNRLKEEEKSHLVEHYYMIHPFSFFSLYFNMIASILLVIYFICVPVVNALVEDMFTAVLIMLPINIVYVALILVSFSTGYYDTSQNVVIMNRGFVHERDVNLIVLKLLKSCFVIVRYVRYIWCLEVLRTLQLYYGLSSFACKIIKMLLDIIVCLVLCIFILYTCLSTETEIEIEKFLRHSENTVKMLMMVCHGRRSHNLTSLEMLLPTLFILVGFIFHLAVLVQTSDIWFKYFSAQNKQSTVYESINAYMRYKALPVKLRERIYLYLEFKYQRHFFKESVIRKATSSSLRKEILIAATNTSFQNVDLFCELPKKVLNKIRAHLISEILLPGDALIRAGTIGRCMFLLIAGTVLVTTAENKPLCFLKDGAHFGEIALVVRLERVINVTAVSPCEIFKLDRQHFTVIMSKYPELLKNIQNKAFAKLTQQVDEFVQFTPVPSNMQIVVSIFIRLTILV
ncbi:hypothetical protein ABEB36_006999 [Hypothenemus hampei]|uniref:Cyclic nucleotide-binding domain-containing protein n=1 Tax=Hypothenemus hampei TaxID=57062 RepID=A0ABD1ESH7_HYPHA